MSNVCFNYQESGSCKFGDGCKFSHEEGDGTGGGGGDYGAPYQGGGGGGGAGICYNWRDNGDCRFGEGCRFNHGDGGDAGAGGGGGGGGGDRRRPRGPRVRTRARKDPGEVQPCWQFRDQGECEYSETCKFSHGETDTRDINPRKRNGICYNFRDNNECRFGDSCRFSHEAEDDADIVDGLANVNINDEEAKVDTQGDVDHAGQPQL